VPNGLPSLVLYFGLPEEGVMQLTDGALQSTWLYSGTDLDSAHPGIAHNQAEQLAAEFNLGSDWMIEVNAIRRPIQTHPATLPPANPIAARFLTALAG